MDPKLRIPGNAVVRPVVSERRAMQRNQLERGELLRRVERDGGFGEVIS
jgi:hypothetical protein